MSTLPCSGMQHGWHDSWACRTTLNLRQTLEKYLRKCVRENFQGYVHVYVAVRGPRDVWTIERDHSMGTSGLFGNWVTTYDLMVLPLWAIVAATMDESLDAKPARDIALVL